MLKQQSLYLLLLCVTVAQTVMQARIERIKANIDGLDCKYCAHNLAQKLSALPDVEKVHVNLKKGWATLDLSTKNNFDITCLKEALTQTKFTLKGVCLTALGTIRKIGTNYLFSIAKSPYNIYLNETGEPLLACNQGKENVFGKVKNFFVEMFGAPHNIAKKIAKLHTKKSHARLTCYFHQHSQNMLGATGNNMKLSAVKVFKPVIEQKTAI